MGEGTYLHQLLTLPTVAETRLSPDKRWVAFNWYRMHENVDVFLVLSDGSQLPIPLTHTPEATELVSWTPDSQAVIVSEDHDGDEFVRLFRVDNSNPLIMHPLTEDRPPYFIRGGMLHLDGEHLFYSANYDFQAGKVIEPTWIYRHNLRTGERLPIAHPAVPIWTFPELNCTGAYLIYPRRDMHPPKMCARFGIGWKAILSHTRYWSSRTKGMGSVNPPIRNCSTRTWRIFSNAL